MRKKVVSLLLGASFVVSVHASAASLSIAVTAIEQQQGAIMLALYDSADAYDGGTSARAARIDVTGGEVSVHFDDLPPGRYAIKLYHDANSNGELDTNMMGLPVEPYGFSGEGGSMGPPPFEAAAFDVVAGEQNAVTVRLR
jgi:uncharacterized protein (DUF2141 family)